MEKATENSQIFQMNSAQNEDNDHYRQSTKRIISFSNRKSSGDPLLFRESNNTKEEGMYSVNNIVLQKNKGDLIVDLTDTVTNEQQSKSTNNIEKRLVAQNLNDGNHNKTGDDSTIINGEIFQTLANDENVRLVCDFCESSNFFSESSFWKHLKKEHDYELSLGGYEIFFNSPGVNKDDDTKSLVDIIKKEKTEFGFECYICNKYFDNQRDFNKHPCLNGSDEDIAQICHFCNAVFSNQNALEFHLKANHIKCIEEDETADVISVISKREQKLISINEEKHHNVHDKDRDQVYIRNKSDRLRSEDDSNNTRSLEHLMIVEDEVETQPVEEEVVEIFDAIENEENVEQYCELNNSIRVETLLKFTCTYCNKSFLQFDNIFKHSCAVKNSSFNIRRENSKNYSNEPVEDGETNHAVVGRVSEHLESDSLKKYYQCKYCDKKIKSRTSLKAHYRVHTGAKPYKCCWCERLFRSWSNLQQHMPIHTGEKPFCCAVCDKTFSRKSFVKVHMRTHTGEKPYLCDICGNCYTQVGDMRRHKIRKHQQQRG